MFEFIFSLLWNLFAWIGLVMFGVILYYTVCSILDNREFNDEE